MPPLSLPLKRPVTMIFKSQSTKCSSSHFPPDIPTSTSYPNIPNNKLRSRSIQCTQTQYTTTAYSTLRIHDPVLLIFHNYMEEECTTPKQQESRIPIATECPPPPRKKAAVRRKKREQSKVGYFHPPELDTFFAGEATRRIWV